MERRWRSNTKPDICPVSVVEALKLTSKNKNKKALTDVNRFLWHLGAYSWESVGPWFSLSKPLQLDRMCIAATKWWTKIRKTDSWLRSEVLELNFWLSKERSESYRKYFWWLLGFLSDLRCASVQIFLSKRGLYSEHSLLGPGGLWLLSNLWLFSKSVED